MNTSRLLILLAMASCAALAIDAESSSSCAGLKRVKVEGVEIIHTEFVPQGATIPPPYPGAPSVGALPAHCRVDGVIHRRKGTDDEANGLGWLAGRGLSQPDRQPFPFPDPDEPSEVAGVRGAWGSECLCQDRFSCRPASGYVTPCELTRRCTQKLSGNASKDSTTPMLPLLFGHLRTKRCHVLRHGNADSRGDAFIALSHRGA